MNEHYDQALRSSYDALLGELESVADAAHGLADLHTRLQKHQAQAEVREPTVMALAASTQARPGGPLSGRSQPGTNIRFLTVAEAASIMRVSKMTVYRLVHSGDLEAVRVGRSFRIPEHALYAYLTDEPA